MRLFNLQEPFNSEKQTDVGDWYACGATDDNNEYQTRARDGGKCQGGHCRQEPRRTDTVVVL